MYDTKLQHFFIYETWKMTIVTFDQERIHTTVLSTPGSSASVLHLHFHLWYVVLSHQFDSEPVFVNLFRSPGIDSQPSGPVRKAYLTYWPARLHRLAESISGLLTRLQIRALVQATCIFTYGMPTFLVSSFLVRAT